MTVGAENTGIKKFLAADSSAHVIILLRHTYKYIAAS